jgi:hypothetical protein
LIADSVVSGTVFVPAVIVFIRSMKRTLISLLIILMILYSLSQSVRAARHVAVPLQQAEQDDWGGDDVRCHGIHAAAAGAVESVAVLLSFISQP